MAAQPDIQAILAALGMTLALLKFDKGLRSN
jgi:hypothetical protein